MASSTANHTGYTVNRTVMYNPYSFRYEMRPVGVGDTMNTVATSARRNLEQSWDSDSLEELFNKIYKRKEEARKRQAERVEKAFKDLM